MDPLSKYFNLRRASQYLDFAIQFTPQYGDSFLEKMRLLLLLDMRSLLASYDETSEGQESSNRIQNPNPNPMSYIFSTVKKLKLLSLTTNKTSRSKQKYDDLKRECVNADPNYGVLWFFSKLVPFDSAQQVLETSKGVLQLELQNPAVASVYLQAMMRKQIGMPEMGSKGVIRPESIYFSDFVTGLIAANRIGQTNGALNIRQKLGDQGFLKLLFGADEIRA